jgi:hypothetical protein
LKASLSGSQDAFVLKLSASGNALVYSTYLGGSSIDMAEAIAVDSTGRAASTRLPPLRHPLFRSVPAQRVTLR